MVMVMVREEQPNNKVRWGDLDLEEDDGGEDLDLPLPAKQVMGPDEKGIKKVIEYKLKEDGNKVKITTTSRIRKLANVCLSKRAVERRSWPKFGDAVHKDLRLPQDQDQDQDPEENEILLERPPAPGTKAEESLAAMGKGGGVLMVCRTCGKKGDHWTARCPYKDLAQPNVDTEQPSVSGTKGAYVPPRLRQGVSDTRKGSGRNEENSVRVTNLSEDTREPDLLELFRPFGNVSRVYVAIEQKSGTSRGFGFVNFVNREDGERAINKLNGYG